MKQKFDLYAEALKTADEYSMLDSERGVLVGYSGGADSSALLHILRRVCRERGLAIHAVHVHHGIRGAEADRDAEFCREQCRKLGVPFTARYADIPRLAKESGKGIEETAREYRYAAFAEIISADERLTCIATAHNADDNAETVIFNLARGTGIGGLRGIPPVRTDSGIRIIRPLIGAAKSDILGYCEENGIEYIFDSTNDDTAYTRNYIRHEIIPSLRSVNPSVIDTVFRMSCSVRCDSNYIDTEAKLFADLHIKNGRIKTKAIADAHEAIASRVISAMYSAVGGRSLERIHIKDVLKLAKNNKNGSSVSLVGGVRAKIDNGSLFFTNTPEAEAFEFQMELKPGINRFESPDFAIYVANSDISSEDLQKDNETLQNIYKLSILMQVNSDKINRVLIARSRREGDSYIFGGMTRKLKKLYNDRGISIAQRMKTPVICDGEGIVWVPGFPAADRVKDGCKITLIYYYNGEENE